MRPRWSGTSMPGTRTNDPRAWRCSRWADDHGVRRACPAAKVYVIIPARPRRDPTMTSSENETWEPQPPALLPPWHTPEREKLQEQARRFAMDEVLPVANELDPQKGEIPASPARRGWPSSATSASPCRPSTAASGSASSSTAWSARSWPARWMSIGQHPRPLRRAWAPPCSTPTAGTSCCAAAPAATGSARSRCPSPTPAPTWPASPTRAVLDGDEWVVTGHKRWCGNAQGRRLHPGAGARARPGGGRVPLGRAGEPAAGEEARRVPRGAVRLTRSTRSATTAS